MNCFPEYFVAVVVKYADKFGGWILFQVNSFKTSGSKQQHKGALFVVSLQVFDRLQSVSSPSYGHKDVQKHGKVSDLTDCSQFRRL